MITLLSIVAAVILVAALVFLLGPRERVTPFRGYDDSILGNDVAAALALSEAAFDDIRDGLQKEIIWHRSNEGSVSDVAIVYVHGFSASKPETRPLPDLLADALEANIFYTRLTGHGRTGAAMAGATANDWLTDMAEAIAVGRRIGRRLIVVGTSTGATAAAFAALETSLQKDIIGMAFISPNFGVQAPGADRLTMPWGRQIAGLVLGKERDFTGDNADYNHGWTTRYPTASLAPMMALVQYVRRLSFEAAEIPLIVLHAPDDQVVDPAATRLVFDRWAGPKEWVDVPGTRGPTHHVIAGDIVNPEMTEPLARKLIGWAKGLQSSVAANPRSG